MNVKVNFVIYTPNTIVCINPEYKGVLGEDMVIFQCQCLAFSYCSEMLQKLLWDIRIQIELTTSHWPTMLSNVMITNYGK
jgi:hypothetical protein